jgi:hypothetical protein
LIKSVSVVFAIAYRSDGRVPSGSCFSSRPVDTNTIDPVGRGRQAMESPAERMCP